MEIYLSPENQSRLAQLADTLDLMEGEPALILAVAPGRAIQQRLRAALPEFCAAIAIATPLEFYVPVGAEEIYHPLQAFLAAHNDEIRGAVTIAGLTELDNFSLEACLKDLNRSREQFRHSLALPIVMWVDDRVRQMMTRQINDFKSWTTAIVFVSEPELQQKWLREQGQKIQQGIEQSDEFQPNDRFLEAADAQELRHFLQQPIAELIDRWHLPPDLAWEVQFWQGRDCLASRDQGGNAARKALAIFQMLRGSPLAPLGKGGTGSGQTGSSGLRGQGLVALHEAWAYQCLGEPEQAKVTGNEVAAEALFATSGRGEDVRFLVEERLGLDAYKFVTIYGPSGVGKSTLVEAGLVPALRRHRFPGGRRGVPVLVRVYDKTVRLWPVRSLDQLLAQACDHLRDYLTTNPTVSDSDRALCGIAPRE